MPLLQDSATWTAVGFAIGAAVLSVALSSVVVILMTRIRREPSPQLETMLQESTARFEGMLADLARELESAREESRRARELSEIGSTIDLDAVLARALEAAATLPRVDAAMIVIPQADTGPVIATTGMSAEEASRQPIATPPDGRDARAVGISYRYSDEGGPEAADLIKGGLVVPIPGETGEAIGTLAVFWRRAGAAATDEELRLLEDLAASSGPPIQNARRFREARKLADLDALTGLHNRRYFYDTLARECARAQRYDRRLALVVLDIDDFKTINDRVGHLAGDSVLADLAQRVQSVVRGADIACRVGGDEFGVILPESTLADAEQLYRRLRYVVKQRPTGPIEEIDLSAGIAELRPEDDSVSFFERADEALYRAKEAGKGQAVADDV